MTGWRPWLALAAAALLLTLPAILAPMKLHGSFWIDWVWTDQFAGQLRAGTLDPRWLPASHGGLGSPVFYFPAWRVTCGGAEVPAFADPATGLLAHEGSFCRLALGWTAPEKAGAAISLAALLALLALIFRTRARRDD